MRIGHKYIRVEQGKAWRRRIDCTCSDFSDTLGYETQARSLTSREAFLDRFSAKWILELHEALLLLLDRNRRILGVGSGFCEHEVLLHEAGFDVVGSDVLSSVLIPAQKNFAGFRAIQLDVFAHNIESVYDDVLITGMDCYYDDPELLRVFESCKSLLIGGGDSNQNLPQRQQRQLKRLIFTLRYHDNLATYLMDRLIMPVEALILNIRSKLKQSEHRLCRKTHGYRRKRREVIRLARQCGFELGRVAYAGFGMELTRSHFLPRMPFFMSACSHLDRQLRLMNIATVFEFIL